MPPPLSFPGGQSSLGGICLVAGGRGYSKACMEAGTRRRLRPRPGGEAHEELRVAMRKEMSKRSYAGATDTPGLRVHQLPRMNGQPEGRF